MKNSITKQLSLLLLAMALLGSLAFPTATSAQTSTYKRGVLMEEFTGTWCPHCPPGAFAMDTMQRKYGDNFVGIAWHGPWSYDEPFRTHQVDTLAAFFNIPGWPTGIMDRSVIGGFSIFYNQSAPSVTWPDWTGYAQVVPELKKAPSVDYRIVNVAMNGASVEFDVDITPFDMSKMRSDDTTNYATIAVLTEDELEYAQENAGDWSVVPAGQIGDFHHMNVVRAVGGGAALIGNLFTMGTKDAAAHLPIRKHYNIPIDGSWNPAMLRIKSFPQAVFPKNKNQITIDVMEAKQTGYINAFPAVAPDKIWIVLPVSTQITSPTKPTNVVWASGGPNAATNVKLEYSVDNGTTWTEIVATTPLSPYPWNIPVEAYGKMAKVRVTNLANKAITDVSQAFPTPGIIKVLTPIAGAAFAIGDHTDITFDGGNYGNKKTFEVSDDSMATWHTIGSLSTDVKTIPWIVGQTTSGGDLGLKTTTAAFIRISDQNGIKGLSGKFAITGGAVGQITGVLVDSVRNGHLNSGITTHITWTATGNLGTGVDVDYTYNGGIDWQNISHLTPEVVKANWAVGINRRAVKVRVKGLGTGLAESETFSVGTNSITGVTFQGLTNNAIEEGKTVTINWTSLGEFGNTISVEYSKNGTSWNSIKEFNNNTATSFDWTPTSSDVSNTGYIRVHGDEANTSAQSPVFKVTSANAVYSEVPVGGYSITNYPNPFSATTKISFVMAERGFATLSLRDELGREVATIASRNFEAGENTLTFSASDIPAGIYSCTLEANGVHLVKKLTVTK